ncbi:MAG: hypothetical protein IPL83_03085 [Bdellovibrionales bacterium]|nr:hypothetical protein [Bdellovibrionales bacterium]
MKAYFTLSYFVVGLLLSVSAVSADARETSKVGRRNEKLIFNERLPASDSALNIKRKETKLDFNSLIDENGTQAGILRESISGEVEVPTSLRGRKRNSPLAASDETKPSKELLEVDMGMGDAGISRTGEGEDHLNNTQVNNKEDLFFEESMELSDEEPLAKRSSSSVASTDRPSLNKLNNKRLKTKIAPN